jgi:[ribosomal protein S18]-alanine N-acetyltransferase
MSIIKIFNSVNKPELTEKTEIIKFLYTNLEEFGDPAEQIQKAVEYSLKEIPSFGGFILLMKEIDEVVGVVVVNRTGMGGYIPENILVYIATHKDHRGKGLGKQLMLKAAQIADGDIALHVEADNPAKHLYEKVGYVNKYLEMRLLNK